MKTIYICEGCGQKYDDPALAQACEAQKPAVKFQPGDIVTKGYGFGWFDGEAEWVRNIRVLNRRARHGRELTHLDGKTDDRNCFDGCCTIGFYYVVTAVDEHEHRTRYHLRTLAMKSGYKCGYVSAYYDELPIRKAQRVPFQVREQARTMRREKHERPL